MRKLGEQWVEEIDGKKHMLKCVKQKAEISHIGEKIHPCFKCLFQMDDYDCAYPSDDWKCDMEKGTIIKDLGILNEDGCLPCPFCGKYPSLIKPEYGYQRLERQSCNGYTYECGCGVICGWDYDYGGTHQTEQEAIDAWNRRA